MTTLEQSLYHLDFFRRRFIRSIFTRCTKQNLHTDDSINLIHIQILNDQQNKVKEWQARQNAIEKGQRRYEDECGRREG